MIGDTVDSDFTYEELSSIVRREKSSGSLSEVRLDLYPAMLRLLDKQSRECERQIGIDIGSLASAAANERRKKIHQSIKLVVEHRMSKVAALAIRTAMGCVNSTENLPPEEKQYFESVLAASRMHWGNTERKKKNVVLMDLESVSRPVSEPTVPNVPVQETRVESVSAESLKDMPIIPDDEMEMDMGDIDFPEDFSEFPESEVVPDAEVQSEDVPVVKETAEVLKVDTDVPVNDVQGFVTVTESKDVPASESRDVLEPGEVDVFVDDEEFDDNSFLTIHVTEDIPEFVGPTRDYRLRKDDVVRMPAGMATVLINRKMAVKLF